MSADFIARLIGMIVFSILGVYLGTYLGQLANIEPGDIPFHGRAVCFYHWFGWRIDWTYPDSIYFHSSDPRVSIAAGPHFTAVAVFFSSWA